MSHLSFIAPPGLSNGLAMTLYTALYLSHHWEQLTVEPEPTYRSRIFQGANNVPIYGWIAIPPNPKGTIVATYGITGTLENQWFLKILGRKAFARGYAIVLFDWRAHGKTAELSPTLTSDGLYEGEDFIRIAAEAKRLGCPAPFWLSGYSLGGQLALWGIKAGQTIASWGADLGLAESEFGGGAVICPSLDSNRSLTYLVKDPWGRYLEKAIARQLKKLAQEMAHYHPGSFDSAAIARANSIWGFDHELVIKRLGFSSVEEYYDASSALHQLPHLSKPTFILYAADDPMFDPSIVPDLKAIATQNSAIELAVTANGGHVGYISSRACQRRFGDRDIWWAWNRILDWVDRSAKEQKV
ncbi:MAG TPA: alpha/beta fold hydrolase [Trichocoleus sp.]|jgi:predicted alpha/beta-fold hydrolase